MYFYLYRNFKNWSFYSVKILKCDSFLIAFGRNSEKRTFYSEKFLKVDLFLSLSLKTLKSDIFN